jgi:hypothetical protein
MIATAPFGFHALDKKTTMIALLYFILTVLVSPFKSKSRVRPGTNKTKRQAVIEEWHREQLRNALPPLIDK